MANPPFDFVQGAESNYSSEDLDSMGVTETNEAPKPVKAILPMSEKKAGELTRWLDEQMNALIIEQETKIQEFAIYEQAYRAMPEKPKDVPFANACTDVMPLIASAVDPVFARLDTGIFRQDPPFRVGALRKSMKQYEIPLQKFTNYYMKHIIDLRKTSQPRLLELAKFGTCVFYIDYRHKKQKVKIYDSEGKPQTEERTTFCGPVIEGVELSDFFFGALHQDIQECPIVFRRIRTTVDKLRALEYQEWITGVDKISAFGGRHERSTMEDTLEATQNHGTNIAADENEIIVYEAFFHYDHDGDGHTDLLRAVIYKDAGKENNATQPITLLQLRLHDAWHGRYPFVVIPYNTNNQSIYGTGLGETTYPFQLAVTRFHQLATDNAFIANARMFAIKRNTPGIEGDVKPYAGKTFHVENPQTDIAPVQLGEIYPSTLTERQNLIGLAEKRTGVSDYLTGRESPIIGSRATATSTLALIQEGTKRVEQVMENIRGGYAEMIEMCFHLWAQYGTYDVLDYAFGDEETGAKVDEFFKSVAPRARLRGAFTVDIGVTDATTNRQVQQQQQLALINVMQMYLEKLVQLGQLSIQMAQTPQMLELIKEVIKSANLMFKDLLVKYDIQNAEDYLPDILKLFPQVGEPESDAIGVPGETGGPGLDGGIGGLDALLSMVRGQAGGAGQAINNMPAAPLDPAIAG